MERRRRSYADHHLAGEEDADRRGRLRSGGPASISGPDGAAAGGPPGHVAPGAPGALEVQRRHREAERGAAGEPWTSGGISPPPSSPMRASSTSTWPPGVFEAGQLDYVREHLRILSGFYGLLRPFDGVTPYRLEMQARAGRGRLPGPVRLLGRGPGGGAGGGDGSGAEPGLPGVQPGRGAPSDAVGPLPHLRLREEKDGKGGREGHHVQDGPGGDGPLSGGSTTSAGTQDIRDFDRLGYHFSPACSTENHFVFIK